MCEKKHQNKGPDFKNIPVKTLIRRDALPGIYFHR